MVMMVMMQLKGGAKGTERHLRLIIGTYCIPQGDALCVRQSVIVDFDLR
jgi:hypothetical protein